MIVWMRKNGETRSGPFSRRTLWFSSMEPSPPIPDPTYVPARSDWRSPGGEPGILDGQLGRGHGEADEGVHLADLLAVDEQERVEVPDLAPEAGRVAGDVEPGQRPDAAFAAEEGLPVLVRPRAERGHEADARDDDPPAGKTFPVHVTVDQEKGAGGSTWRGRRCSRWPCPRWSAFRPGRRGCPARTRLPGP